MVVFAESEHNRSMRVYETRLGEAKASDPDARAQRRESIEDSLVREGMGAIEEYEKLLNRRWQQAGCIAEYEGVQMGFSILRRAKARLAAIESTQENGIVPDAIEPKTE
jgi:hypothetical protein